MTPLSELLSSVRKEDLDDVIERMADPVALEWCVAFFVEETRGCGHGRRRTKMARRFKHVTLSTSQRVRIVDAIARRLASGDFSEAFKDQLRLGLFLDPERMLETARESAASPRGYIAHHAKWTEQRALERLMTRDTIR